MGNVVRLTQRINLGDRAIELVDSIGRIDLDNLHDETESAGADAIFYGVLAARARRRANAAKLTRDTIAARIGKKLRERAVSFAETRPTDKAVADAALLHEDYQVAAHEHLDLEEQADVLESVKFTMARKQSHCEALANLLMQEEAARHPSPRGPVRTPFRPPNP